MLRLKLTHLFQESYLPRNLWEHKSLVIDADGTDCQEFTALANIQKDIKNFVGSGKNLYIYSAQAGNGKTSWSIRLMQQYFKSIWLNAPMTCAGLFINVPYFLQALKDNISERSEYISKIKENVTKCDLVIWDDISNKVGTDFEINNLLGMIDARINAGKSNIYTSNVDPAALANFLDIRLASRISSGSICIGLHGGDKRHLGV